MIIVNLNIRGLGGGTKPRYMTHLIGREEADFVCIQETKAKEISEVRCFALWGRNNTIKGRRGVEVFCHCGTKMSLFMTTI